MDTPVDPATMRRLRRLSLKKLIYFAELERHRNFGRAAKALGVSQPTLSQQIAELEDALGTSLIDRSGRGLRLTEEGDILLGPSRKVLQILADTVEQLGGERKRRPLRIGIPSYMSYPVVSTLLRRFRTAYPSTFPHLMEVPAEEMSQFLNDGELDAGFLTLPTPLRLDRDMCSLPVWEAPTMVCLSRRHPLASKPILEPSDLAKLDIVLIPREHHTSHYDFQLAALRDLGIEPRLVTTDVTNTQSQMGLASAGLGSCLISAGTIPIPDDLVLRPTRPSLSAQTLALFWSPRNRNPTLDAFRHCVAGRPQTREGKAD